MNNNKIKYFGILIIFISLLIVVVAQAQNQSVNVSGQTQEQNIVVPEGVEQINVEKGLKYVNTNDKDW